MIAAGKTTKEAAASRGRVQDGCGPDKARSPQGGGSEAGGRQFTVGDLCEPRQAPATIPHHGQRGRGQDPKVCGRKQQLAESLIEMDNIIALLSTREREAMIAQDRP